MPTFLCIDANLCVRKIWKLIQHETILTILTFINVPSRTPVPSLGLGWRSSIIFDRFIGMTQNSKSRFIVRCLVPISAPSQLSSHESPSQWNSIAVHEIEEARFTALPASGHWLHLWSQGCEHTHFQQTCASLQVISLNPAQSLSPWPGTPKRTIQGGHVKGAWGLVCAH